MDTAEAAFVPAGTRFRRHEHACGHVCVVLGGGFLERERGGWRDVGAGTVRVSGAARHDIDFGPAGAHCLVLEADPAALEPPSHPRFLAADPWLARLAERWVATARGADPARAVVADGVATELLAQIDRRLRGRTSAPPPWLERVRQLLHDTAGETPLADLALESGVHRVHLARTFRDHYGVPLTVYARRVRLQAAHRLLATTDVPLAQVAARAGFADQSHFTRVARATLGATPGSIRRTLRPFKTAAGPAS